MPTSSPDCGGGCADGFRGSESPLPLGTPRVWCSSVPVNQQFALSSVILPSYQVCDDEDELGHIEWLRQVSLIAGYKGPLPIFRPGKRRES
jgi:hypothetical protein